MRFAGSIGRYLKDLVLGEGKMNAVMDFAPDLLYAGLMATQVPGSAGSRLAVGGEDAAIGIGSSLAGRALGRALGPRFGLKPGSQGAGLLNLGVSMGVQAPMQMLAPRPVYDNAMRQEMERQRMAQGGVTPGQPQQLSGAPEERRVSPQQRQAAELAAQDVMGLSAGPLTLTEEQMGRGGTEAFDATVRKVLGASGGDPRLYAMLGVNA